MLEFGAGAFGVWSFRASHSRVQSVGGLNIGASFSFKGLGRIASLKFGLD